MSTRPKSHGKPAPGPSAPPSPDAAPPAEKPGLAGLWSRRYPLVVALLLCAVVLAVTQSSFAPPSSIHDALGYVHTAQRLLTTGTFAFGTDEGLAANAVVTPGYPLVLAALYALVPRGDSAAQWAIAARPLVTLVQLLMVLGIVACLTMSGQLLGGRRMALVAGVLGALYTPYAFAASVQLSDLLGTLLVAGMLLAALSVTSPRTHPATWRFVALGLLAGATAMVRPAFAPWLLVPLGYFAVSRRHAVREALRPVALVAAAALLVMVPWWIRNAVTLHAFVPLSTNAGMTMLDANGGRDLTPTEQALSQAARSRGGDGASAVAWSRIRTALASNAGAYVSARNANAWRAISSPANAVVDVAWENANHYDDIRIDYADDTGAATPLFVGIFKATTGYHLALLIAAHVGLLFIAKSPRLVLAASLPVYVVAIHYFTVFNDRYFMPAMAGTIVLAAAALVGCYVLLRRALRARVTD